MKGKLVGETTRCKGKALRDGGLRTIEGDHVQTMGAPIGTVGEAARRMEEQAIGPCGIGRAAGEFEDVPHGLQGAVCCDRKDTVIAALKV